MSDSMMNPASVSPSDRPWFCPWFGMCEPLGSCVAFSSDLSATFGDRELNPKEML